MWALRPRTGCRNISETCCTTSIFVKNTAIDYLTNICFVQILAKTETQVSNLAFGCDAKVSDIAHTPAHNHRHQTSVPTAGAPVEMNQSP
jgi:hypothetical protein